MSGHLNFFDLLPETLVQEELLPKLLTNASGPGLDRFRALGIFSAASGTCRRHVSESALLPHAEVLAWPRIFTSSLDADVYGFDSVDSDPGTPTTCVRARPRADVWKF